MHLAKWSKIRHFEKVTIILYTSQLAVRLRSMIFDGHDKL